jgi:hypothetical protein
MTEKAVWHIVKGAAKVAKIETPIGCGATQPMYVRRRSCGAFVYTKRDLPISTDLLDCLILIVARSNSVSGRECRHRLLPDSVDCPANF